LKRAIKKTAFHAKTLEEYSSCNAHFESLSIMVKSSVTNKKSITLQLGLQVKLVKYYVALTYRPQRSAHEEEQYGPG